MMKYLFECHFNDGTVLQQTEEDVSTVDQTRSAFYDVMQRNDDIVVFGMFNYQNTYAVDLRDGSFLINNAKFTIPLLVETEVTNAEDGTVTEQKEPFVAAPDQKFQLIYFRRHRHLTVVGAILPEELTHEVEFHIGWSTQVNGEELRQTIIAA
jgi:hypothetical protein